jgi:hypothetical protein
LLASLWQEAELLGASSIVGATFIDNSCVDYSSFELARRRIRSWRREIEYRSITGLGSPVSLRKEARKGARALYFEYLDRARWQSQQKIAGVSDVISLKHFHAWRFALESKSDFLIVCEDDAHSNGEMVSVAREILGTLSRIMMTSQVIYVDIAGGLPTPRYAEVTSINPRLIQYSEIVENTTCAYAINAPAVEYFVRYINANSRAQNVGIDDVLRDIAIAAQAGSVPRAAYAFRDPRPLRHDSFLTGGLTTGPKTDRVPVSGVAPLGRRTESEP